MKPLQTVKIVGRFGYLNSDPALPFVLPSSEFGVTELAQSIQRAAMDYDISTTWENCRFLALGLMTQLISSSGVA